jgi:hypothetical protein
MQTVVYHSLAPALGEIDPVTGGLLKAAGVLAIFAVGLAAVFIIPAAITKKPGTIWAEGKRS